MFARLAPLEAERCLEQSFSITGHGSILAGISRSLRLSHRHREQQERVAVETAASVVGPLVFLFVWSFLFNAQKQGVRRLYFLARDGEIFFKVAKTLISAWQCDIEAHYLYCSRESLFLPAFKEVGSFEIEWITWAYTGSISWQAICERVGITVEESAEYLRDAGCAHWLVNPQKVISRAEKRIIPTILRQNGFVQLVQSRAQERYELVRDYFRQEGLLDGVPMAVVDTGWRGTSQFAISALLDKGGAYPEAGVTGYYLGVNTTACIYRNDQLKAFLFDWRESRSDYQLYNFICYEMLCGATHGRTLGYHRDGCRVVPILGEQIPHAFAPLVEKHHELGLAYAQMAARYFSFSEFNEKNSARAAREIMRRFICRPNSEEASIYGEWPMASEICENDMQTLAPPMSLNDFLASAVGRKKIQGFWPQASLVRGRQPFLARLYNVFLAFNILDWYRRIILRY